MKLMASVIYNFVQKISSLISKKSGSENEVSSQSNKPKSILMEIQKILIWDDPFFSCCFILSVNVIFWLIIYLDLKFYGIFFTTLLILTCEQLWVELFSKNLNKSKNGSQNATADSSKTSNASFEEINSFFKKFFTQLKEIYTKGSFFRQSQPGMFCILTCVSFLLLGVIGSSISGILTFYVFLMIVMTVPGMLVRVLPPQTIKDLSDFFYSSRKGRLSERYNDIDDEVEPYLPDTSNEALELLRLAGDLQLTNKEDDEESNDLLLERISEHTTESVTSKLSFYPESEVMPSPDSSMDFWNLDLSSKEKTDFSETESNPIYFQSKYFDGDSSEEEFIKGLDIPEETSKMNEKSEVKQNNSVSTTENLISVDKKVFAEQIQRNSKGSNKESSSDTDSFELISEEEM